MAWIRQKDKRWYVGWREGGQQRETPAGTDRRTALQLKAVIERNRTFGLPGLPEDLQAEEPKLEDMFEAFAADLERTKADATCKAVDHSQTLFFRSLRQRYPRRILRASDLSLTHLRAFDTFLQKRGCSVSTRVKRIQHVTRAWRWLAEESDEYGDYTSPPKKLEMPVVVRRQTKAPTWEEMDACIEAANGWHKKLAIVLRCTGLRVDQAMKLRCDDIDRKDGLLVIRPELGKSPEERRGRTIPVTKHLVNEVAKWGPWEGWLIPCNRKPGPREREARARDMVRAWKRSGVRGEVWAAPEKGRHGQAHHAFRKGFVTGLRRLGADPDAVEYLVGHSLGLRGVYTDPDAYHLHDVVGLVPPIGGDGKVTRMPKRTGQKKP